MDDATRTRSGVIGFSGEKPAESLAFTRPDGGQGEVLSSGVVVQTNPRASGGAAGGSGFALGQAWDHGGLLTLFSKEMKNRKRTRPRSGRTAPGRRRPRGRRRLRRGARAVPRAAPQRSGRAGPSGQPADGGP